MRTKISNSGRVVIPAHYRKALGLKPGDEVVMLLEDGEIRLLNGQRAIARAQAIVRRYFHAGRMLSEELIEERRKEAGRD